MSLTNEQTQQLIEAGKKRNLTREQMKTVLNQANEKYGQQTTQDTRTWSQKLQDVPILGDLSGTITTAGTGLGALLTQGIIDKRTSADQAKSLELAKQAQKEKDPTKKQQLLEQSRQLSQGAGELATKQAETVRSGIGYFSDRESPTNLVESLKTYGPQAVRTGVTAGSLLAPMLAGAGLAGFAPTAAGRIVGAGTQGALMGGIYGLAQQDEATATQRLEDSLIGAGTGAVVGTALQGLIETAGGIKNAIKNLSTKASSKLKDVYSSTLKQNVRDQKFYKQYGGIDNVVDDAIKYDVPSTKEGVQKTLNNYKSEFNQIMDNETARLQSEGKRINLSQAFKNARKTIEEKFSYDKTLQKQALNWFDSNKQYLNKTNVLPATSNQLRVQLDQQVGNMVTSDTYGSDAARKAFATELRKEFKNIASNETKEAIKKYQLLSGLSNAMQKEPVIGITETAMAAASPGKGILNIPEFLLGKAIRSPGVKRTIAKTGTSVAGNISKSGLESASRNVISPFRTEALRNALNQSMSKNKNNVFSNF